MAVRAGGVKWLGLACVLALVACAATACLHSRSPAVITGPLPAPLALPPPSPRPLDAPQWEAVVRWSHPVTTSSSGCERNDSVFCLPLAGGGLAYADAGFNGYLLDGAGRVLPHPWFDETQTAKSSLSQNTDWYNQNIAGDPAEGIVWSDSHVVVLSGGGLAVANHLHCYFLDSRGQVSATAELPRGYTRRQDPPLLRTGQAGHVLLWGQSGRQLELDQQAQVVRDRQTPADVTDCWDVQLGGDGQFYRARMGARGIECLDADGQPIWENRQFNLKRSGLRLRPVSDGRLLVSDRDGLYLLDGQGRCSWSIGATGDGLDRPDFTLGADGVVTLSGPAALHFLKLDGTEAAPPLAMPLADPANAAAYWSWVPNPSGGVFVRILSDPYAAVPRNWVFAISPQGQPLWRVAVALDFELLCATDTGLLYGLQNRQSGGTAVRGGGWSTADAVCLVVTPPA